MHCTCTASYVGMGCRAVLPEGALSCFFWLRAGRMEDGVEHCCTCTEAGILLDIFNPMLEDFV